MPTSAAVSLAASDYGVSYRRCGTIMSCQSRARSAHGGTDASSDFQEQAGSPQSKPRAYNVFLPGDLKIGAYGPTGASWRPMPSMCFCRIRQFSRPAHARLWL